MTPESLARKNTESGHQKAVFAFAAMACYKGFAWAHDERAYSNVTSGDVTAPQAPVPELKWLHAIPNGGARDAATAARMKAEGARRGVYDMMLPVARKGAHGLYIEMKIDKGVVSPEQIQFGRFVTEQGYAAVVCRSWQEAVETLQKYLTS